MFILTGSNMCDMKGHTCTDGSSVSCRSVEGFKVLLLIVQIFSSSAATSALPQKQDVFQRNGQPERLRQRCRQTKKENKKRKKKSEAERV